jgi:hypothetical protein
VGNADDRGELALGYTRALTDRPPDHRGRELDPPCCPSRDNLVYVHDYQGTTPASLYVQDLERISEK